MGTEQTKRDYSVAKQRNWSWVVHNFKFARVVVRFMYAVLNTRLWALMIKYVPLLQKTLGRLVKQRL